MKPWLVEKALTEDATQLPPRVQAEVEKHRATLRNENASYPDRVDALAALRQILYF